MDNDVNNIIALIRRQNGPYEAPTAMARAVSACVMGVLTALISTPASASFDASPPGSGNYWTQWTCSYVGGRVDITSTTGHGTRVAAAIPIA